MQFSLIWLLRLLRVYLNLITGSRLKVASRKRLLIPVNSRPTNINETILHASVELFESREIKRAVESWSEFVRLL